MACPASAQTDVMIAQEIDVRHLYKMFQNKIVDFLEDLRPALSSLPEYKLLRKSMDIMSPETNYALFDLYVAVPYGTRLIARDEDFFLDKSFAPGPGSSDSLNLILMIKEAWSSLTTYDRDAIWAHLAIILKIRDRIRLLLPQT